MSVDISQDFLFLWLIKKQSGLRSISSPDVRGSSLWGSEPKGKFAIWLLQKQLPRAVLTRSLFPKHWKTWTRFAVFWPPEKMPSSVFPTWTHKSYFNCLIWNWKKFSNAFQPGSVQPLHCSASRVRRSRFCQISPHLRRGWTWQLPRTRLSTKSGESVFWEEPASFARHSFFFLFFHNFHAQKQLLKIQQAVCTSLPESSVRSGESISSSCAPLYTGLEVGSLSQGQGFAAQVAPSGFSVHFSWVYTFTCCFSRSDRISQ